MKEIFSVTDQKVFGMFLLYGTSVHWYCGKIYQIIYISTGINQKPQNNCFKATKLFEAFILERPQLKIQLNNLYVVLASFLQLRNLVVMTLTGRNSLMPSFSSSRQH